jgi:hypothetical protein
MTSVLSVMSIASCVYNSFSFTESNINNRINVFTITPHKYEHIKAKLSDYALMSNKIIETLKPLDPEPEPTNRKPETPDTSDSDDTSDCDETPEESVEDTVEDTVVVSTPEMPPAIISAVSFDDIATFYTPKPDDSLLWCSYIMLNGIEKFEMIDNYYMEGNTFKYQVVGDIRSKKMLLKPHKLTLSKIEDSLVNKPFINLEVFYAIALSYNISVCVIQGRKIFEIGRCNDDSKTVVIEKKKGKYGVYLFSDTVTGHKQKTLDYIRDNYWSMENISSPIRPLSAYKLPDLVDICKRLTIPTSHQQTGEYGSIGIEKRKTKGELYEAIIQTI